MSTKLKAVEEREGQPEELPQFSEELPPLSVDPTSFDARLAGVEMCSVARELSKHWGTVTAYEIEQELIRDELKKLEEAPTQQESWERELAVRARSRELWQRKWEPKPDDQLEEHIQYIKRKAVRFIDWGDLGQLWNTSPLDAIELWKAIRLEARDEFISGHYGAQAFESAHYMHEAFARAQYLSIRDGFNRRMETAWRV